MSIKVDTGLTASNSGYCAGCGCAVKANETHRCQSQALAPASVIAKRDDKAHAEAVRVALDRLKAAIGEARAHGLTVSMARGETLFRYLTGLVPNPEDPGNYTVIGISRDL